MSPSPSSLPPDFLLAMQAQLQEDYPSFLNAFNDEQVISIRVNPNKSFHVSHGEQVPWCSQGWYLNSRPSFTLDPHWHAGSYYVQEASSMFLEQVFRNLPVQGPLKVLDLCAAPGGKSTHLLSLMNKDSLLVSNEVIRSRTSILLENCTKWGHSNQIITQNDPSHFKSLTGFFDVILVDAPCSGEGLFRKDSQAAGQWSTENITHCALRQQRILEDIWPALKEGGCLIYSTCTYNKAENEDNLKWLQQTSGVTFLSIPHQPDWGIVEVTEDELRGYRFFPHKVKGEGLFISACQKTTSASQTRTKPRQLKEASKAVSEKLSLWVKPDGMKFLLQDEFIYAFPEHHLDALQQIAGTLHVVSAGTSMARAKHDKLVPEHGLALSVDINLESFPVIDADLDTALAYLRRETISSSGATQGFNLLRYEGHLLGWVNVLQNRINNLYPTHWRIRMSGSSPEIQF